MRDAEQMQHRGVQVVHVHDVLDRVIAEIVRGAVGDAALDASPGEPHGEGLDVVVAPIALRHRGAPEFAAVNNECVVEHAALPEVCDQRRSGFVDQAGGVLDAFFDSAVMIPATVVKLDETHATLSQPTGEQAVAGVAAVAAFGAVHVENLLWLVGDIHQLRHARLHAKRHFVLGDACLDFRVAKLFVCQPVESLHGVDDVALLLSVDAVRIVHVEHRVALTAEAHALEAARQKAAVPLPCGDRLRLAAADRSQHDETGQVVVFAAETVVDPRAHRGPAGDDRAGVHERVRRVVVDLLGLHRANDRNLIRDFAEVRKDMGELLAGLPPALELVLRSERLEFLPLKLRDLLAFGERLRHRLAVQLGQFWFVVERLEVRRAAGHAQEDHALGLDRQGRRIHHAGPLLPGRLGQAAAGIHQRTKRSQAKADAGLTQEAAPVQFV